MKSALFGKSLLLGASLLFPTFGIAETAADYNNSGIAKLKKGDIDGAIADCSRALKLDPKFADAYTNRGIAKVRKDDFDGAIADYSRALKLDPKFAAAYRRRGIAEQDKSDFDGAIADYDRALEFDPNLALAYADRGISYLSSRRWNEALKDFNRFLELSREEQEFPRLFIWMITVELNGVDAANRYLTAYLATRPNAAADDWYSRLAGHVLGKVTEGDLFAAAKSPDSKTEVDRLCEAWFFSGMKRLIDGDKTAAEHFRKCLATGRKVYVEYQFAQMELKSLAQ